MNPSKMRFTDEEKRYFQALREHGLDEKESYEELFKEACKKENIRRAQASRVLWLKIMAVVAFLSAMTIIIALI